MQYINNSAEVGAKVADEYATKDLYFASFLFVKGIPIKKLEKYGGGSNLVYFVFEGKARCEELEGIYWSGMGEEIMINARDLFTAVRDLKARAFSITRAVGKAESNLSRRTKDDSNQNF